MISATFLAIFFVPLFFMVIVGTFSRKDRREKEKPVADDSPAL